MNKKPSLSSQSFLIYIIFFCLICSLFAACRINRPIGPPTDTRPCVANITVEGSAMSGRRFKTFQDFSDVTRAAAFDQIVQSLATSGWTIASSSKETGVITSWAKPRFSKGETESLNVVVRDKGAAGILVEITYLVPAMAALSKGALHNSFCKIMADVESAKEQSSNEPPPRPPKEPPKPPTPQPPTPPESPKPPPSPTAQVTKTPDENLREKPNGKIIGKVKKGTTLFILEEIEDWLRIRLKDGTEAWIWKASTSKAPKDKKPPKPM